MERALKAHRYSVSNSSRCWSREFFRYLYVKTLPLLAGIVLIYYLDIYLNNLCIVGNAERAGILPLSVHSVAHSVHYEVHGSAIVFTDVCLDVPVADNVFALTVEGKVADVTAYVAKGEEVVLSILLLEGSVLEVHFPCPKPQVPSSSPSSLFASFYEALQGICFPPRSALIFI